MLNNNIYTTGTLYNLNFDGLLQAIVKLSPDGEVLQTKFLSGYQPDVIALHDNRIFVATRYAITEFSHSLEILWEHEYEYTEEVYPAGVVGLKYRLQFVNNTIRQVNSLFNYAGDNDLIDVKALTLDGDELWSCVFAAHENTEGDYQELLATDMVVNEAGETFIIGRYADLMYGGGNMPVHGADNESSVHSRGGGSTVSSGIFVTGVSSQGTVLWTKYFYEGVDAFDLPRPIAVLEEAGQVLPVVNVSDPERAQFVAGINPSDGTVLWEDLQTNNSEFARIAPEYAITGGDGSIYTSGRGDLTEEGQGQYFYLNKYYLHEIPTRVKEITEDTEIHIRPNPSSDYLYVSADDEINSLRIYSADGRLIIEKNSVNSNEFSVDIATIASGVYLMTTESSKGLKTLQFVKE